MQGREDITAILREQAPVLAERFGVQRLGLFGSQAKNTADVDSDVDLVVELERPLGFGFIELADYLEQLLGRRVDVLTPAGLRDIRLEHVARDIEDSIVYV